MTSSRIRRAPCAGKRSTFSHRSAPLSPRHICLFPGSVTCDAMATATPGFRPNMSIATEGSMGRRSASPLLLGGGEDLPSQPAMALIVLMPGVPEGREAHGVEREGRLHDFDGGGVFGQEAAR